MYVMEEVLYAAEKDGASDVHFTVGIPPMMRVNGMLERMDYPDILPGDTLEMLLHVMTEVQREYFEEHGEFEMSFCGTSCGRYRVSIYKQRGLVAFAFRFIGNDVPSFEELGIPDDIKDLGKAHRGIILVAGPAGSGKTTTLAALINEMNSSRCSHIITIESPIEFLHPHKMAMINQREIGSDSHNYARALKSALREDPDIIFIDEICDFEVLSLVLNAAEAGYLVLSAVTAVGASNAIDSLVDKAPLEKQKAIRNQLGRLVEAVITQHLIHKKDGNKQVAEFEITHI